MNVCTHCIVVIVHIIPKVDLKSMISHSNPLQFMIRVNQQP